MNSIWIILIGTLVASACSILGCFLILRRMAMLGDGISHAILPGIVIAFLISGSRDATSMLIGAMLVGLLTTFLIQWFKHNHVQADAALSVTFTALFAIGIILISLYTRQIDLDLDCVLYGEIAYAHWDTWQLGGHNMGPRALWMVGGTFLLNLILILLFYKQLKLTTFDPAFAAAIGIPVSFFHYLLMGMVSLTTVASFESVGAILVVAMLIVPAATAYLWTDRFAHMLSLSILFGTISAIGGFFLATAIDASIAGSMTVMAGLLFFLSFLFAPQHGLIRKWHKYKRWYSKPQ